MGLKVVLFGVLLLVGVLLAQTPAPTYRLIVRTGVGSGWYACGAIVTIQAAPQWQTVVTIDGVMSKSARLTFAAWDAHGWADAAFASVAHQARAILTMPCAHVTLDPTYAAP